MTKRILIVDDEPSLAFLLAANLAEASSQYQVETYNSSMEALAEAEIEQFDLVITDFLMPDINGLQLIRILSKLKPTLKFILMTTYSDELLGPNTQDLNLSDLIVKPFKMEKMFSAVHSTLAS